VLIVAHLPLARLRYLRETMAPDHRVQSVDSWGEFLDRVRQDRPHVVVVDPTVELSDREIAVDAVQAASTMVPVVVYTALSPSAARAVQTLRAASACVWLLAGIDDEAARFRLVLEKYQAPGIEDALVVPLLAALGATAARPTIASAVRQLFRAPARFRTAKDLAAAAGVTRRWLNECLGNAGLAPARVLVSTARVLGAYNYLRKSRETIARTAAHFGYPDVKSLRRHAQDLTGMPPSAWAIQLSEELCIAHLATRLGVHLRRPAVLVRSARDR
jgi:AraC-like DNA-binding protein